MKKNFTTYREYANLLESFYLFPTVLNTIIASYAFSRKSIIDLCTLEVMKVIDEMQQWQISSTYFGYSSRYQDDDFFLVPLKKMLTAIVDGEPYLSQSKILNLFPAVKRKNTASLEKLTAILTKQMQHDPVDILSELLVVKHDLNNQLKFLSILEESKLAREQKKIAEEFFISLSQLLEVQTNNFFVIKLTKQMLLCLHDQMHDMKKLDLNHHYLAINGSLREVVETEKTNLKLMNVNCQYMVVDGELGNYLAFFSNSDIKQIEKILPEANKLEQKLTVAQKLRLASIIVLFLEKNPLPMLCCWKRKQVALEHKRCRGLMNMINLEGQTIGRCMSVIIHCKFGTVDRHKFKECLTALLKELRTFSFKEEVLQDEKSVPKCLML